MRCAACGHENRPAAKFCEECATAFAVACPYCDAMLRATAKFCDACGTSLQVLGGRSRVSGPDTQPPTPDPRSYTPKHLADKILQSKSALEGERKQVTVLFADVKGSMELAEQVDPEEWHRILDRFFQILADGVHRFEGTVNQYTGDGIMALFGAPIAHEDHAQRACYAALRLGEDLRGYAADLRARRGLNFSVRMGLNSGEVVVGKIGDDLRMDYTAQGHTVGLAARMEQLAEPGRVYLTEHAAKLVDGLFRLGDLGLFTVKGAHDPVRVYELQGVGPLRTRLEVAVRRGLSRFVGRREQLEQLQRAWEAARAGHGQIVAVMGEAGIGKSRLFHEFKGPLQTQCPVLETFSVSHGKAYAYLPVIDLLRTYFRIALEDDERTRREKVTGKVLALDRTLEDTLPYVFALLGIADPTSALPQMDAQVRRRRTLEAVKRILVRETLDQPLTLICEDLHWFDGESQDFLDLLVESVATARLLLLVNYRPEYHHGWGSKTYYTQLRLDPLGKAEAGELLTALLGAGAAAGFDRLQSLILDKTEGNPFFIEEVVQTLAEQLLQSARPSGDAWGLLMGHHAVSITLFWQGELLEAREHLQQAFDRGGSMRRRLDTLPYEAVDQLVFNRAYRAQALLQLGYPEQAIRASRETMALAQAIGRPSAVTVALFWDGELHRILGDVEMTRGRGDAVIALATEHGFSEYGVWGTLLRGCAFVDRGQIEAGITELRGALDVKRAAGSELAWPYYACSLASAYGKAGQPAQGLAVIEEAVECMNRTGQRLLEAELDMTKGDLLRAMSRHNEAEAEGCLRHAFDWARRQGAKSMELRAALSLSRLWRGQGKHDDARTLLAEIYGWFTEGFETRDLTAAKAVLDELSRGP